jgi:integrase
MAVLIDRRKLTQQATQRDGAKSATTRAVSDVKAIRKPYMIRYWVDGRQREQSFTTRREALDFKAKVEHDTRAHIFVDPKQANERFADAAERWVSRLTGAANTKENYRRVLRLHVNPVLGDRPLRSVAADRDAVQTLLLVTLPGKNLGGSVIRTAYQVIRAVVNDAVKAGRLTVSRLDKITLPPGDDRAEFVFPSHTQLDKLVAELPEEYRLTVWLMRGCGLRIAEALAVRADGFTNGTLRVSQQLLRDKMYAPLKHRRPGEFRDVPVPAYVAGKAAATPVRPDGYFFTPVGQRSYARWFTAGREAAGIPDGFSPHSLRHVFASVALSSGVPITDVSRWLGHRNIQTTFAIYGHLVPSAWDAARAALDREYEAWRDVL